MPPKTARKTPPTGHGADVFPVVGIGASAGGLDALKKLFSAMPADGGMAFVLVPHLDPTHESLMVELLAKQTAMPVCEARDGMPVRPDQVYVIPPNADLTIEDRILRVSPPPPRRGSHTSIDVFLRSLAADQTARAIGIILSGTGSHGTTGAMAIRAAGGMVLAQTPESAEHDQMPRSAMAAHVVDQVLPPEQMPQALLDRVAELSAKGTTVSPEDLSEILRLVQAQGKCDFRGYRHNMVLRRVTRRMGLRGVDRAVDYVEYLRAHPDEVQALSKNLLISVTAFFREANAFQVLERVVIPELVQRSGRDVERPIRVWVPGCATGEEAYSLAILFFEQFTAARKALALRMFATDVDNEALEIARAGLYPDTIAADVSSERLRQFFVKADPHHLQVSKDLREVITFAPQNVVGDAPFSKLDLVSCRNVLIYFEPDVQAKVIALFHFALNEGGYLVLGPAESIGPATDRFEPVSKKWRVYRRIGGEQRDLAEIPVLPVDAPRLRAPRHHERPRPAAAGVDLLQRTLLTEFAPAAVMIDRRYEIRSVEGPVVDYLEFPPGELSRSVLAMARPGLRAAIRSVCEQAAREHRLVSDAGVQVRRQDTFVPCTVTARPLSGATDADGLLAVTFEDHARRPRPEAVKKPTRSAARRHADESTLVRQLEHELAVTREDLQGTIDELKMANEELKASHEEVMSMNEELQSTNEEMETSKEELQSLNEELSTVNSQLQDKVQELDAANNDMVNLLASTEIATVFLDAGLRIKRFTPPTARLLTLLATDLGRPFRDLAPKVADPTLLKDCGRVIEKLVPLETVVRADDARVYLRRVLPYRTADNRIDGVVITWVDVTQRMAAEAESRRLSAVLRDSNDAVILLDLTGRIIGWNRGAERLYGHAEADACAMNTSDLIPEAHRPAMGALVQRLGRGEAVSESLDTRRTTKDGRTRDVWTTMTLLRDHAGQPDTIVATERDMTERKEGLAAKQAAQLYQQIVEQLPAGAVLREDGRLTMNGAAEAITGYSRGDLTTVEAWCTALHGERAVDIRPRYEMSGPAGSVAEPLTFAIVRKDGQTRHVDVTICRLDGTHDLWMLLDMTERDQAEAALRRSEDYLQSIVTTAADAIITINRDGAIETFNSSAERMFGYAGAEVVGQNVRLLMPSPYRDEHDGYIARYLKTGKARIIGAGREVVGQRKDGTTFPLDLAVSEIDSSPRFTGILRDLSDRRQLEWRLAESQLEERRHMARELHDEVGGHMTGIGLLAQTLHGELVRTESPLAARSQELTHSIRDAHQRLRKVIRGLMPVEAIPEGLMAALDHLATQCEAASGIRCQFQCDPPVHIETPGTAKHLFRIAEEAVKNAVRHGQPSNITISLGQTDRRLELVVTDDGRGLGRIPPEHVGIGLDIMRQRARLVGGECTIQPRDGGGTVIRCWVPRPGVPASGAPPPRKSEQGLEGVV